MFRPPGGPWAYCPLPPHLRSQASPTMPLSGKSVISSCISSLGASARTPYYLLRRRRSESVSRETVHVRTQLRCEKLPANRRFTGWTADPKLDQKLYESTLGPNVWVDSSCWRDSSVVRGSRCRARACRKAKGKSSSRRGRK